MAEEEAQPAARANAAKAAWLILNVGQRHFMRELRINSVISAGLSLLLMAVAGVSLAGGSSSPKETNLWIVAIIAGAILATTSVLYTATEAKKFGLLHGALMAIAAIAIFYAGIRCLPDRADCKGGFVEMIQVSVAGGMLLFGIAAASSALQTFFSVSKKKLNQPPEPMPLARHGSP